MNDFADDPLVTHLHAVRQHDRLVDAAARGRSFDEAMACQLAVADRFAADGDGIGGWKIGFTSGASRDRLGPGVRPFGYVLKSRIFASGATISAASGAPVRIEPELVLVLGTDLAGGDVDAETARDAVTHVAAGFELLQLRVPGNDPDEHPLRIADGLSQWGMVVGDTIDVAEFNPTTVMRLTRGDETVETRTMNDDLPIDDVFETLATLARQLHAHGRRVHAGDVVLTGSFAILDLAPPERWRAEFSGIGEVTVDITLDADAT